MPLRGGVRPYGLLVMAWARWRGIALFARDGTLRSGIYGRKLRSPHLPRASVSTHE